MIKLSGVGKTFTDTGEDFEAVKNIDLTIEDKSIFGIIGFSGAGKSTLVRCINMLERPTTGSVEIDGTEMTALGIGELNKQRKKIGMIFQRFNLFPSRTIYGNVAYPLRQSGLKKEEIRDKVRSLLKMVDIAEKEESYPSQLSGGQMQRVAIARALATDPKILLCDEATSALDPQTTKSILHLLKKLNESLGITIVVITHEMSVVKEICDKVAIMDRGEVVETGDVFSIFSNPKEEITKQFIRTTSNLNKIEELIKDKSFVTDLKAGEKIVRLRYLEKNTSEPLISTVSREFNLNLNVIFADIEIVHGSPIGGTVAIFSGAKENIDGALKYLREKNVGVEVLNEAAA